MKKWETWPHNYVDYSIEKLYPAYLNNEIEVISKEAQRKLKCLSWYYQNGLNARKTCRHFGIHPSTFYEWRQAYNPDNLKSLEPKSRRPHRFRQSKIPLQVQNLVCQIRKEYPAWSKYKLAVILKKRFGIELSASSVGRIMKKRGLINQEVAKKRRRAALNPKLRAKGTKYKYPGSHVEIDTKHVSLLPGIRIYQFTAIDSVTKQRVIRVYSSASSRQASQFLSETVKAFPFKIITIQTDNGSEFAGEFNLACRRLGINHCFVYPYSPDMNALVERSHRTDDEEFYLQGKCADNLEDQRKLTQEWEFLYNNSRPHQSLKYLTPNEYYEKIKASKCR